MSYVLPGYGRYVPCAVARSAAAVLIAISSQYSYAIGASGSRHLLVKASQLLIDLGSVWINMDFHVTKSERWLPQQEALAKISVYR